MKDPYAPGFWCSVTILGTLTASYFYGIRQTQQMNQAVHFLYAAAAVTVAVALVALTWIAWQQLRLNKREVVQGRTLLTIWNTKVALRRVETVFDRYSGAATGIRGVPSKRSWASSGALRWSRAWMR